MKPGKEMVSGGIRTQPDPTGHPGAHKLHHRKRLPQRQRSWAVRLHSYWQGPLHSGLGLGANSICCGVSPLLLLPGTHFSDQCPGFPLGNVPQPVAPSPLAPSGVGPFLAESWACEKSKWEDFSISEGCRRPHLL